MLMDELLTYLFDGQSHLLAEPMAAWLASSRRFTAFVNTHHTKIRKKIRTAQELESQRDLQLELETAHLLLRERYLSVMYEPGHPERGRSPDFAVTFTTSLVFMVEVTRLRAAGPRIPVAVQEHAHRTEIPDTQLPGDRFSDMLRSKLGQLLPQRSNLLLVGMEAPQLTHPELHATMLRLKQRAEANDSTVVHRHGFRDRAEFFNHYQRLSALLVRGGTPLPAGEPVVIWVNPQAKYPLPARVRTVLSRSHTL